MWCLGIVYYELLKKHPPFTLETVGTPCPAESTSQHMADMTNLTPRDVTLLRNMLRLNPDVRVTPEQLQRLLVKDEF